jgi:prophage regulatory protein
MNIPAPVHSHESTVERVDVGPLRFIRFAAVCDRTGLSRSTIWRLERRGVFPKHRRLSTNAVGWLEQEIDQWVRSRLATR